MIYLFQHNSNILANGNENQNSFLKNETREVINVEADNLIINQKQNIISAYGNVLIQKDDYKIKSDYMLYNQVIGSMKVDGNVQIFDQKNELVYYASSGYVSKNANQIEIYGFKSDEEKNKFHFDSDFIEKKGKEIYEASNISFTFCETCKNNNLLFNQPFWKIKAKKIKINTEKESIIYDNASFYIFDKRIFSLKNFVTPTLNVKHRSGFLIPKVYFGGGYGVSLLIPYYISFSPNFDATVSCNITNMQNNILDLQVRNISKRGAFLFNWNLNYNREDREGEIKNDKVFSSYFEASGNFLVNKEKNVNIGFKSNYLFDSNTKYIKKYHYNKGNILVSNLYANFFSERSYGVLKSDLIQDLRSFDVQNSYAKRIKFRKNWNLSSFGKVFENSDLKFDVFGSNLQGKDSLNYNELYSSIVFSKKFFLKCGILNIRRFIIYNINSLESKNKTVSKLIPGTTISYEIPLSFSIYEKVNNFLNVNRIVVKPVVNLRLLGYSDSFPEGLKNRKEFLDPYDILDTSIYSGILEQGLQYSSLQYGIKSLFFLKNGSIINFAFAKGHRFNVGDKNARQSSVSDGKIEHQEKDRRLLNESLYNRSDKLLEYVVYFSIENRLWNLENRTWLKEEKNSILRSDTVLKYKGRTLSYDIGHVFTDYLFYGIKDVGYKNEVYFNTLYRVNNRWSLNFYSRNKIGGRINNQYPNFDSSKINYGFGIKYANECVEVSFNANKNFFKGYGLKPSTTYSINLRIPFYDRVNKIL